MLCLSPPSSAGSSENEAQSDIVEPGGELNLINSTMSTLDPIQSTDTASARVLGQAYENLTHYPNGETRLENQLLDSVELSDDLLTYTFSIKQGVQYHDNPIKDELTAHDFKYAWRRLGEANATERANFLLEPEFLTIEHDTDADGNLVPDSIAVTVIDDYTLQMTLESPNPSALDIIAYDSFAAMPEGSVGDVEGYSGEYSQEEISASVMVGTGPFQYDTWESGSEARVVFFDDYWGEGPYLGSIHWAIISSDEAIWTYSMEQNADFPKVPTGQYDPDLIDAEMDDRGREVGTYGPVENGEILNYVGVPELSTFYVAFNAPQVPRPVRRAVADVTNHRELIDQVFKGRGQEAFSFTPPGMWPGGFNSYTNFGDNWPYGRNSTDIGAAEQRLSDAGYTSSDPFELTLTTYASDPFQQFGRLTRDKLSGIGVSLQLEEAPFSSLIQRGQSGELEFYSLGWIWSWVDPAYGLFGFEPANTDTSRMPELTNGYYLDWDDIDTDPKQQATEAWNTVVNNPEPEAEETRNEAYVNMERAIREDMVLLPLFHNLSESFRYDWVNAPKGGALGSHRNEHNTTWLDADAPNRSSPAGEPNITDDSTPTPTDDSTPTPTGDEHRETARSHRDAGEYDRAIEAYEKAQTAYKEALDTAPEDALIDTGTIKEKLTSLDEEQRATRRQQLQEEVNSLQSTLDRAETLASEDELDEAQSTLESIAAGIQSARETATQNGFADLQDTIAALERRREDRFEAVSERLQARPIPEKIPRAPSLSVDYDALRNREPIGAGGNADVTKATLPTASGDVILAIKEPRMSGTLHTDAVERLLDEAETWDKLDDHDHIVGVVDYGSEPLPWIAMEYMDAGDLDDRAGELDIDQALWTATTVTKAVRHAHDRGVAHLDLKPSNILFRSVEDAWDVPKVADWGLSKHLLDHSKSIEGLSPHYAAPEQFDADTYGAVDHETDIYQLGAVFYELFTGQPPFEGKPFEVMNQIQHDTPTPPSEIADVPAELDEVLLTAIAREKGNRYEHVLYLRDDLQDVFDSRT
jgi:ABC-type transport system substrate-binding protein